MHILLHHVEAAAHHVAFTVACSDPQVRLFKLGDAGPFLGRRFGDSVAAQALLGLGGARMRGLTWPARGRTTPSKWSAAWVLRAIGGSNRPDSLGMLAIAV